MPPAQTHAGQTIRQARAVVKPVLANPYATPWPTLPNHLQNGVMAALPQLVPDSVAEYHTDRARCSQAAKRARRKVKRGMDVDAPSDEAPSDEAPSDEVPGKEPPKDDNVPSRPEILDHLVLGLNETIRALETAISSLRLRMTLLAEGRDPASARFLPTEPGATPEPDAAGITYLLIPHTSVSPLALIDPLPTYCATYNTLLRQAYSLPNVKKGALGDAIRIVPLGKREPELALAAGLRRITSIGVRASHPAVGVLERLLQAALPPPRHSMTLPWPTTALAVHTGKDGQKETEPAGEAGKKAEGRAEGPSHPPIAYAPLHIKAIHTSAPADPGARKAQRLAEVRAKRVEKKANRFAARKEMERKVRSELSGKFVGAGKGRASRRAAKAAKAEGRAKGADKMVVA
ncbi:hypothetical protein CC85DRAFT_285782 [Cutaneotrichosporon oleaginosum]|uniref:Uncharacterized protein n=1 Tax=Cutaneotrichosporon oleaginosum TaxID=879819 RepID=A0A0J0XM51_9TREE|nr:uncharacterized protein CC85DRAFT_285782 [Cutaneotrichosporon oleaginosum]KLT42190.1 hypothetical protein CC85DRAFT_285782 [Cutaneotrichosporon oleaginosum]TXT11690.1 hypothetical protein COLE_02100 [Cutaneotrichosporon oleaginosum]